jgi:hypothetical protein
MRIDPVKSTGVSWRRWALYGGLVAAVYTGVETYADLETKSLALYVTKLGGSIVAGAILGVVAARVRNRLTGGRAGDAKSDGVA